MLQDLLVPAEPQYRETVVSAEDSGDETMVREWEQIEAQWPLVVQFWLVVATWDLTSGCSASYRQEM